MSVQVFIILVIIGLFAGIFSGFVGLGGGVIIIPALLYFLHMNQYEAQGTSLAVMLPPIGLLAAYNYYKAGQIDIRFALIIATTFLIGGFFGSKIALHIPENTLRKVFGIFLLLISIHMILKK